jgi:hypothetical protein
LELMNPSNALNTPRSSPINEHPEASKKWLTLKRNRWLAITGICSLCVLQMCLLLELTIVSQFSSLIRIQTTKSVFES